MIYVIKCPGWNGTELMKITWYNDNIDSGDIYIPYPTEKIMLKLKCLGDPDQALIKINRWLRPFKCFGLNESGWYRWQIWIYEIFKSSGNNISELLNKIESITEPLEKLGKLETEKELDNFYITKSILEKFGILEKSKNKSITIDEVLNNPEIQYTCDLYNYIETIEGTDTLQWVIKYNLLSESGKNTLGEFNKNITRDKKLNYIISLDKTIIDEIIDFLPKWYRLTLEISSENLSLDRKNIIETESTKTTIISSKIDSFELIRKEIYDRFSLGDVIEGDIIKEKLSMIYKTLGLSNRKAKIRDIFDYFETRPTRNGYRLITKKL